MTLALNDPDRMDNRSPRFIAGAASLFERTIFPYHRTEVRGLERIPRDQNVIYVGNHNGYPYMTEFFLFTSALFTRLGIRRYPYILAHDFSLKLPLINQFLTNYGCLRASLDNARRVLEQRESLLIYPGGGGELMRPYRERTRLRFQGRMGYARLAIEYGCPIVPVVAVGGHSTALIVDDLRWLAELIGARRKLRVDAWPLMLSIPWGVTLGPFIPPYVPWPSRIVIEVLEPIAFPPASSAGMTEKAWARVCADRVERTIEDGLVRLEAERTGKPVRAPHDDRAVQGVRRRFTRGPMSRPHASASAAAPRVPAISASR
jgi:1-acyl-sn-glycerol-3-phosphate acyltransferase